MPPVKRINRIVRAATKTVFFGLDHPIRTCEEGGRGSWLTHQADFRGTAVGRGVDDLWRVSIPVEGHAGAQDDERVVRPLTP
mmetsp:Transcript_28563/g.53545  ORF Transcript_28563/g.53545 Transcript_28563/m.53545 type:complete len:82 (-) Transcript_28563:915-1160(-)